MKTTPNTQKNIIQSMVRGRRLNIATQLTTLFILLVAFIMGCSSETKPEHNTPNDQEKCGTGYCRSDQVCKDNQCVPRDSSTCDPKCKDDEVCKNGTCVTETENNGCDPKCKDDEVCKNGTCVAETENNGCDPKCKDGKVCKNGTCVAETENNGCDPKCEDDEVCQNGTCVTSSNSCDPKCKDDEVCRYGNCIKKPKTCDPECNGGEVCKNGQCYPNPFCKQSCEEGKVCSNGTCVDDRQSCTSPTCTETQFCKDNTCVTRGSCLDVICNNRQHCDMSGTCVDDPNECPALGNYDIISVAPKETYKLSYDFTKNHPATGNPVSNCVNGGNSTRYKALKLHIPTPSTISWKVSVPGVEPGKPKWVPNVAVFKGCHPPTREDSTFCGDTREGSNSRRVYETGDYFIVLTDTSGSASKVDFELTVDRYDAPCAWGTNSCSGNAIEACHYSENSPRKTEIVKINCPSSCLPASPATYNKDQCAGQSCATAITIDASQAKTHHFEGAQPEDQTTPFFGSSTGFTDASCRLDESGGQFAIDTMLFKLTNLTPQTTIKINTDVENKSNGQNQKHVYQIRFQETCDLKSACVHKASSPDATTGLFDVQSFTTNSNKDLYLSMEIIHSPNGKPFSFAFDITVEKP